MSDPFTERRLAKEGLPPHLDRIERFRTATVAAAGESNAEQIRFSFQLLETLARLIGDEDWDEALELTRKVWDVKQTEQ